MYPLRFCRTIFKFELYRETVEIAESSILEVCDQAKEDEIIHIREGQRFVAFISFTLRREHCAYTVRQPRNAAVILIINID